MPMRPITLTFALVCAACTDPRRTAPAVDAAAAPRDVRPPAPVDVPRPARDVAPAPADAPVPPADAPPVDAGPVVPEGFDRDTVAQDVDGDGRPDLVRPLPPIAHGTHAPYRFVDLPPALVAHRLATGQYAVDDGVARAALRALCPEAPPARFEVVGHDPEATADRAAEEQEFRARTLFLDAVCARAWGRPMDAVAAALRATAAATDGAPSPVAAALAESMVAALAPVRFAFTLRPLGGPFPTVTPAASAGPDAGTPRDAGAPDAGVAATASPAACRGPNAANERALNAAVRAVRQPAAGDADDGDPEDATPPDLPEGSRCLAVAGGVWSLRLGALVYTADDEGLRGPVQLRFGPGRWTPVSFREPWSQGRFASQTWSLDATFDWDHDGRPEVALRSSFWAHEGESGSAVSLYTTRAGGVVPYAASAALDGDIESLTDDDGDGRPDLVIRTPWRFVDGCGMSGIEHEGPTLLAHSLPDGTFSLGDRAARAWFDRSCARLGRPGELPRQYDDRDVWRVACARVGGASPEQIVAALRAEHGERPRLQPGNNDQQVCYSFEALASMALVAGPFATAR